MGLSTYSSIVQLVNTLPSNSILTFTITNSEWEQSLYPMLWGEVFIQKYSTRARVIFTSQQISSDDNYVYIKYTNYNEETDWSKFTTDMQYNSTPITVQANTQDQEIVIPFEKPFKRVPVVVGNLYAWIHTDEAMAVIKEVTASNFTIRITSTANWELRIKFNWIALHR